MTYIVPNHFIEQQPQSIISSDSLFTLTYTSKRNQNKIAVRTTTHSMILLLNGSKNLSSKHKDIMLNEGDILLLTQGNYFMSEVINDNGVYEALMVYFNDDFIMNFITKYAIDLNSYNPKDVVSFSSDSVLKSLIHSYTLHTSKKQPYQNDLLKLKTEEILLYLLQNNNKLLSKFLKSIQLTSKDRIAHILEANIDLISSIEDMTKLTRVSKTELRHATQKSFHMQPKAWLDSKRMEKATLLLRHSQQTITSIATSCGYSTTSWFGVQFKKIYNLTPKQYREQNQ